MGKTMYERIKDMSMIDMTEFLVREVEIPELGITSIGLQFEKNITAYEISNGKLFDNRPEACMRQRELLESYI